MEPLYTVGMLVSGADEIIVALSSQVGNTLSDPSKPHLRIYLKDYVTFYPNKNIVHSCSVYS